MRSLNSPFRRWKSFLFVRFVFQIKRGSQTKKQTFELGWYRVRNVTSVRKRSIVRVSNARESRLVIFIFFFFNRRFAPSFPLPSSFNFCTRLEDLFPTEKEEKRKGKKGKRNRKKITSPYQILSTLYKNSIRFSIHSRIEFAYLYVRWRRTQRGFDYSEAFWINLAEVAALVVPSLSLDYSRLNR